MSRVYFHSPSGTAELSGSERAWLSGLVSDVATGILNVRGFGHAERLRPLIHPDHYLTRCSSRAEDFLQWATSYEAAFTSGWSERTPLIQYAGEAVGTFSLTLNTALVVGGDPLRLAARLHGSCEIHAWVDGPNRAWLADIMQAGLDTGLYRPGIWVEPEPGEQRVWVDQGWQDVIALLRARDDEPVVTSYSVTDGFPSSEIGDWMPPWPDGVPRDQGDALTEEQSQQRREEEWEDLNHAEKWRISMAGLRASEDGLELKPENWASFRFGHTLSVLDLLASDWETRLGAALGLAAALIGSDDHEKVRAEINRLGETVAGARDSASVPIAQRLRSGA